MFSGIGFKKTFSSVMQSGNLFIPVPCRLQSTHFGLRRFKAVPSLQIAHNSKVSYSQKIHANKCNNFLKLTSHVGGAV